MPAHIPHEGYLLEDDKHEVLFRDLETVGKHAGIRIRSPSTEPGVKPKRR